MDDTTGSQEAPSAFLIEQDKIHTLKSREDLADLLALCPVAVRSRVGEYIVQHAPEFAQLSMFRTASQP